MGKTEKKINKRLIGAVIGGTLIGLGGLSMTPKGRSFWQRMFGKAKRTRRFLRRGVKELRRFMGR